MDLNVQGDWNYAVLLVLWITVCSGKSMLPASLPHNLKKPRVA